MVVEDNKGILDGARNGQIIVDTDTVTLLEIKAMAKKPAKKKIDWMDVSISGAASQAAEANMVFMVAGKKSVFKSITPVLYKSCLPPEIRVWIRAVQQRS